MIQILRKAQKQQGDGQTSLDEEERTPLTKEQKEARLKDETQKKQAQEQKEARLKDETQKKQDLRLKQEQEEQQKKKAQEEEEQKKKRKQTSLRKKEEETHLKDEDTKQKKDKKKAEDVALKRARLETAKRETEEKKAITADKKQKAAASKEKQERAQIVVQGLRSLSQTGIHNMSAVDREQFFALAMEYKALASTGAIQFEQQEEVESMLQQLTGLASDKSEVNFYLTKAQEERAEKERKNAEKMADFLKSFKKNPYIIYEDIDSFVQAVEEGHISADTIVTNAQGEEVTLRTFTREELTERANRAVAFARQYDRTSEEYRNAVAGMAAMLCEMNPEDAVTTIEILKTYDEGLSTAVKGVYQRLNSTEKGRALAREYCEQTGISRMETDDVLGLGLEVNNRMNAEEDEALRHLYSFNTAANVSRKIGDDKFVSKTVKRVETRYKIYRLERGDSAGSVIRLNAVESDQQTPDSNRSVQRHILRLQPEDSFEEIEEDSTIPGQAINKKGFPNADKEATEMILNFGTSDELKTPYKAVATLSNAANNGPSVVGGFGDKVPMNDYADDFGYNQGGNGHRNC